MLRAYSEATGSDIKATIDLSYLDRAKLDGVSDAIASSFEEFDAILTEDDEKEQGPYRGYYTRQRQFRLRQPNQHFERFEPP